MWQIPVLPSSVGRIRSHESVNSASPWPRVHILPTPWLEFGCCISEYTFDWLMNDAEFTKTTHYIYLASYVYICCLLDGASDKLSKKSYLLYIGSPTERKAPRVLSFWFHRWNLQADYLYANDGLEGVWCVQSGFGFLRDTKFGFHCTFDTAERIRPLPHVSQILTQICEKYLFIFLHEILLQSWQDNAKVPVTKRRSFYACKSVSCRQCIAAWSSGEGPSRRWCCRPWLLDFRLDPFLTDLSCLSHRKDQKKVAKLKSKIPYFEARKQQDEVDKLNQQIENVYKKAQEAMNMALA